MGHSFRFLAESPERQLDETDITRREDFIGQWPQQP